MAYELGISDWSSDVCSCDLFQGALVGIGVVPSAVFEPMAVFGGSAGIIYKQFAITIVSAMGLSVLVALIFTPALCATMLKPSTADHHNKKGFFGWFNRVFDRGNDRYQRGVAGMIKHRDRKSTRLNYSH